MPLEKAARFLGLIRRADAKGGDWCRLNCAALVGFEGLANRAELSQVEPSLGRSFKTPNCIENLNSLVARRTDQVDYRKTADQKHRWLATTLLDMEPRLHKVFGHRQPARLRTALQMHLKGSLEEVV